MPGLLESFRSVVKEQQLFSEKDQLLIAVSGGVDSVVLCELCYQAKFVFGIAHCNFQLRGAESERDEEFTRQLATRYGVPLFVKKFDTESFATDHKLSTQEAARTLRYAWFSDLLVKEGDAAMEFHPRYLLTAHHADDNAETLLMNFFRGTGLRGLTGIPVSPGNIRRPLLSFTKESLIGFASGHNLSFVEDSSNQASRYTRNFFRHQVIPLIESSYPHVRENLQDNLERFKGIEALYRLSVGQLLSKLVKKKGEETHIPIKQLLGFDSLTLVFELISPYGFSEKQVAEVIRLAQSESGRFVLSASGDFRIIKHRHWFIIAAVKSKSVETFIIVEGDGALDFGAGRIEIMRTKTDRATISSSWLIAQLDAAHIRFPLLLRKWKPGDYFYPLGMKKKKKLSRFFIDQKLSKTGKENAWVLEMNRHIIWVVGMRIDDRYRVTDSSKETLRLTVTFFDAIQSPLR